MSSNAEVICFNRVIESAEKINDCELHIAVSLGASQVQFILVEVELTSDITVQET